MEYVTTIDHERDEYNQLEYREEIGFKKGLRRGRREKKVEMTENVIFNCLQ